MDNRTMFTTSIDVEIARPGGGAVMLAVRAVYFMARAIMYVVEELSYIHHDLVKLGVKVGRIE